jgi:hypothetical protein
MMMKPITEAQRRLIAELAEELGSTIYEYPKTQHGASVKIEKLMRQKRNARTNLYLRKIKQ